MGMNVLEIKGIAGDAIGFRDNDKFGSVDDSIDSVRFRNGRSTSSSRENGLM